jgi:rhodanese-related sulfurtransferase
MGILKKLFGSKDEKEEAKVVAAPPPPLEPTPEPEPEPEVIQVNQIEPDELKTRLDNGDELIVIDMRQEWEYEAGHIPGAMHMFIQEIPTRFNELPKDVDIVFQCWHGNSSLGASAYLIENGWDSRRVFSLGGGIAGWVQAYGPEGLTQD